MLRPFTHRDHSKLDILFDLCARITCPSFATPPCRVRKIIGARSLSLSGLSYPPTRLSSSVAVELPTKASSSGAVKGPVCRPSRACDSASLGVTVRDGDSAKQGAPRGIDFTGCCCSARLEEPGAACRARARGPAGCTNYSTTVSSPAGEEGTSCCNLYGAAASSCTTPAGPLPTFRSPRRQSRPSRSPSPPTESTLHPHMATTP